MRRGGRGCEQQLTLRDQQHNSTTQNGMHASENRLRKIFEFPKAQNCSFVAALGPAQAVV